MAIWSQLAIVSPGLHGATWLLEAMCFARSIVCFVLGFEEKCWSTQAHSHTHKQTQQSMTVKFHTHHSKYDPNALGLYPKEP